MPFSIPYSWQELPGTPSAEVVPTASPSLTLPLGSMTWPTTDVSKFGKALEIGIPMNWARNRARNNAITTISILIIVSINTYIYIYILAITFTNINNVNTCDMNY